MSMGVDSIAAMIDTTRNSAAVNSAASLKTSANGLSSESTEEELMTVCKDFASYFGEEVLKEVKENMTLNEDEEEDSSIGTLKDFHMDSAIELIADEIVDQSGSSFTQQLFEQMKRNYGITDSDGTE